MTTFFGRDDRIFVAGHRGMVGSAIVRELARRGHEALLVRTRAELDLRQRDPVFEFFHEERPSVVFLAAARVGGIQANIDDPAGFLLDNLRMQNNVIEAAVASGVRRFCFLASSCCYPRECAQPMREDALLTGPFEPTNEGYALAKVAGVKLVAMAKKQHGMSGFSVLPCNLYGTNDSYDPLHSHVLTAVVRRCVDAVDEGADRIVSWGTGSARREFLHVDDAAAAIVSLAEAYDAHDLINVGSGEDVTIRELVELVANVAGFTGELAWDPSRPDGMPRKCMDIERLSSFGFAPRVSLEEGVRRTVAEYRELKAAGRLATPESPEGRST